MRGVPEGKTRKCKVCGATYERQPYGWCYAACCSNACLLIARAIDAEDPRGYERHDCVHHRQCLNEAAAQPREYVCRPNCERYEQSTAEPEHAKADLHSAAWMWSEA